MKNERKRSSRTNYSLWKLEHQTWNCIVQYEANYSAHKHACTQQHREDLIGKFTSWNTPCDDVQSVQYAVNNNKSLLS